MLAAGMAIGGRLAPKPRSMPVALFHHSRRPLRLSTQHQSGSLSRPHWAAGGQTRSFVEDTPVSDVTSRAVVRAVRQRAKIVHQRRVPCAGGERRFLFPATRSRFASAYSRIMSVSARSPAGI